MQYLLQYYAYLHPVQTQNQTCILTNPKDPNDTLALITQPSNPKRYPNGSPPKLHLCRQSRSVYSTVLLW